MGQTNSEKDLTKNDVIEGINYREMWNKFEGATVSYNKSSISYESVIFGLKEIEDEVNKGLTYLENKRKEYRYIHDGSQYHLGLDRITDYSWILSLMHVKRTMDMIWKKSEDEAREKEHGKGNCNEHKKLLNRYCKILKNLANTYIDDEKDEKPNKTIVFQYGSNCLENRINSSNRLQGKAKFFDVAKTVENYQLDFNVYSKKNDCAAADILKSGTKPVWGVLYCVSNELMCRETAPLGSISFDEIEGEGSNYRRHWLPVICPNGKQLIALTYVVRCPSQRRIKTKKTYAQLIIDGLKERNKHGIPTGYIDEVKQIIKKNNSEIDVSKL